MKTCSPVRRRTAGFTLIEMMIATSISGVLASVAYPGVTSAVQKARRSEALVALIQVQQAQERWRSNSSSYGTLAEIGVANVAPARNYLLSMIEPSPSGYVALAQATGAQAGDRQCRFMKLSVEAGNAVYSSGETAAATNATPANRQCWNQ